MVYCVFKWLLPLYMKLCINTVTELGSNTTFTTIIPSYNFPLCTSSGWTLSCVILSHVLLHTSLCWKLFNSTVYESITSIVHKPLLTLWSQMVFSTVHTWPPSFTHYIQTRNQVHYASVIVNVHLGIIMLRIGCSAMQVLGNFHLYMSLAQRYSGNVNWALVINCLLLSSHYTWVLELLLHSFTHCVPSIDTLLIFQSYCCAF